MTPFMTGIFEKLGNQFPEKKTVNKTVRAYNERIDRAREKVKDDQYITVSNMRSKRYDFTHEPYVAQKDKRAVGLDPKGTYTKSELQAAGLGDEKKLTKRELKALGLRPTEKGVSERQLPSTAIGKMRYNPQTGDLYITFRNGKGKEYLYPHVGKAVVQNFLTAGSKGRYYWNRIRPYRVSKAEALEIKARNGGK